MEQVIANLIGNAVEHGEEGTPDGLPEEIGWAGNIDGSPVGLPIDDSAKCSLFNPMVRHRQSGNVEYGAGAGLGLGLYIASAIVEAHQGSIDVDSSAVNGITFTVRIPLNTPDAA
jgi:signal transduction histidine kinase